MRYFVALTVLLMLTPAWSQKPHLPALADVHLHYNADQESVVSANEAVTILKQQNVQLAIVSSTPPELALTLQAAAGDWVIPLYRPYYSTEQRFRWFNDSTVLAKAERALHSGRYHGIGELHLIAGIGPGPDNPILNGLIELGITFDVPLLIHIETSSEKFFQPICRRYSQARFLLAHAGGLLNHENIGRLLRACPNVWVEFSARDRWRYTRTPIVDRQGSLLPGWRRLIEHYPERFMIGSDPYWPLEKEILLEEADSGWLQIDEYLAFHRQWLADLPPALRKRVEIENAKLFFQAHQ